MRKSAFILGLAASFAILACGGGGAAVVNDPTFQISWLERTRAPMIGPASATSARITFAGAGVNGADLVVNVDRNSDPAAYTGTYHVGSQLTTDVTDFQVDFYAAPGQNGPIVATGNATITWQGSAADLGEITVGKKVASVAVVDPGPISEVAAPFDMEFVAKDAEGTVLAVSPGSAVWTVVSGATSMTVAADGTATPLLPGTTVVRASVDGIESPNEDVAVTMVQITYTDLDNGTRKSQILGGSSSYQFGAVNNFPGYWSGTAASYVDLSPIGITEGKCHAGDNSTQVGYVRNGSPGPKAALWAGTAASYVNLHPAGGFTSGATCMRGNRQGGYAEIGDGFSQVQHPAIWQGTAASYVSLMPAGATRGSVQAMNDDHEVGSVNNSLGLRAAMWSGTPESFVDLSPTGTTESWCTAIDGDTQVGVGSVNGVLHPFVWKGTAASAVDLFIPGANWAYVHTVVGNFVGGLSSDKPTVWNATTKSYITLDGFMPSGAITGAVHAGVQTSTGYDFYGVARGPNTQSQAKAVIWHVPARRMPQ